MGYYSRKRNIRKFWDNPLVNLCYVLSVLAFVVGVFALFGALGGAGTGCLIFGILALAAGVGLIILGKKLSKIIKPKKQESRVTKIRKSL